MPMRPIRFFIVALALLVAGCAAFDPGPPLARVLEEEAWHPRLLNGSDYPLPGMMPIFSLDYLVSLGLLAPAAAPVLRAIREHNPLLFDFVLKRHLRSNGKGLAPRVFETRSFFQVKSGDVRQ